MTQNLRHQSPQGFTRAEGVVLLALVGIVTLFSVTYLRTISRRERLLRNASDIQFLLISARQTAVKRNQQVVVLVDLKGRRIVTWADELPNLVQDAAEPTLSEYRIPADLFFRYAPGEAVNGSSAVCFDGYAGNPSLTDRVVFRPDGTLVAPEQPDCRPPRTPRRLSHAVLAGSVDCNPGNRCRGIYLSDSSAARTLQNSLRVSVDDPGQPAMVTILKWLPLSRGGNAGETDYVPPPWKWTD
jgi:type II secretory pathway pseudopilin PulG